MAKPGKLLSRFKYFSIQVKVDGRPNPAFWVWTENKSNAKPMHKANDLRIYHTFQTLYENLYNQQTKEMYKKEQLLDWMHKCMIAF